MSLLTSLISYWKMDEASGNALDSHGTNELTDNATVGTGSGKINTARDFEVGNLEYFSHADNTDLSTGDIDFTFAAWVQFESLGGDDDTVIAKGTTNGIDGEYEIRYGLSATRIQFNVWGSAAFGNAGTVNADALGAPATATWYYVIVWHDATGNTINIQVNNGTVNSTGHSAGVFDGSGEFQVGGFPFYGNYHDGLIDEVAFWKRTLTSEERGSLWNGGNGLPYSQFEGLAQMLTFRHRTYRPRPFAPGFGR